jgi:hypothetical protein
MTSEQPESAVEVIQADRVIAVGIIKRRRGWSSRTVEAVLAGNFDTHDAVQGVAAGRLATQPAEAQGAGDWKLVPRVPTPEIIAAIRAAKKSGRLAEGIWQEALAAAPTPQRADAEDVGRDVKQVAKALRKALPFLNDRSVMAATAAALAAMPRASQQAGRTEREVTDAVAELVALANLIERPPHDDVQLVQSVAMRTAAAIRVVAASLQHAREGREG